MTGANAAVGTARWRWLLAPRVVAAHLLVVAVVTTCVALGQWQLDRLRTVRASNALLAERMAAEPVDLAGLLAALPPTSEVRARESAVAELAFRRVTATGTFRPDEEVLHRNRNLDGFQGSHVLTPLELSGGGVVLVVRGWVPPELDDPPVTAAPPPPGEVTVSGVLEASTPQPARGARDPDEGRLERVFHADTARLDRQVEGDLAPVVLRLVAPSEAAGTSTTLPRALGLPTLSEANHRSYAVQWHAFAAIALGAHVAWLRGQRRAKR